MNELIEKLFDQAKVECFKMGSKPATTVGYDELERFAELIVRECIDKISQEQGIAEQNWQCKNGVHICYELTKHFGVEE